MPHDRNGRQLKAGDVVTMAFRVREISSTSETQCNVTLEALNTPDGEHAPVVACNSRFAEWLESAG